MGGADWETKVGRSRNRARCNYFGSGTLSVRQMGLSYFFADRDDDSLPSNHGSNP